MKLANSSGVRVSALSFLATTFWLRHLNEVAQTKHARTQDRLAQIGDAKVSFIQLLRIVQLRIRNFRKILIRLRCVNLKQVSKTRNKPDDSPQRLPRT